MTGIGRLLATIIVLGTGFSTWCQAGDLKTYQDAYEKKLGDIIVAQGMELSSLAEKYATALKQIQEMAQKAGDLDKTKAVLAETERFAREKTVWPTNAVGNYLDLKAAQLSYVKENTALEITRAREISLLAEQYDKALGELQVDLTKQGKLDDASAVQAERKRAKESSEVCNARNALTAWTQASEKKDAPAKPASEPSRDGNQGKKPEHPKPAVSVSDDWIRSCVIVSSRATPEHAAEVVKGHKVSARKNYSWAAQVDEKRGVAILHPLSDHEPASITYTPNRPLSPGDTVKITLRGSDVTPGGRLKVRVNEKPLQEERFDSEWVTVEVPIDAEVGTASSVQFEFWPVEWNKEYSYIDAIEVIRGAK